MKAVLCAGLLALALAPISQAAPQAGDSSGAVLSGAPSARQSEPIKISVKARKGSRRSGGSNNHGKGSHYTGGHN